MFDFLKKPIITEKAIKNIEKNKYTFDVDAKLTKKQIKKIFEELYSIRISSIQTHRHAPHKKGSYPLKRVIMCLPIVGGPSKGSLRAFSIFSSDTISK